jgi:hypothetical protein
LSAPILPPTTAGIHPERFSNDLIFAKKQLIAGIVLAVFILVGFVLRINNLGVESLGEDELNKLQTVEEYRRNGLSGKNGEHPFLMKGLQTVSLIGAERINDYISSPELKIRQEAALRFPIALFGTFTTLLIFLFVGEMFGRSIGLISAALWAVEPMAIGFDRIAKEDSLVLFFFLLANVFFVRSQTAVQRDKKHWDWYAWATAASFAALMASKYYPHLLAITGAYYNIFKHVPGSKWNLLGGRWVKFFLIMGITFVILNPTILLPDTWREMLKFSSENRIGHDSYDFMGALYGNKMSLWLSGVPWTFYYVFIAVKTSASTLLLFLIGLPLLFKRQLGDGRFFLFFWAFMWFLPFTFLGGKFTRYFTFVEPLILIGAAVGFYFSVHWISQKFFNRPVVAGAFQSFALVAIIGFPLYNSLAAAPHFRLFTNMVGGGNLAAGSYFPHDEFYDAGTREIVARIAAIARPGATIASETPLLFEHYARQSGRGDLICTALSDRSKVAELKIGDFIVVARGRRYFSNSKVVDYLGRSGPTAEIKFGETSAALVYQLDATTLDGIKELAK